MDRTEHVLLLACARAPGDAGRRGLVLECLSKEIDWEYLLQAAATHRLTSVLYWQLNSTARDLVPPAVLERLRQHYLRNTAKVLLLTARLQRILVLFEARGISAIPYKGPALAHTLYEDPGVREFNDLDILVGRVDVLPALELLTGLGYEAPERHSPRGQAEMFRRSHHCAVAKDDGSHIVEIHWTVVDQGDRLSVPMERWWARAGRSRVAGQEVRSLAPEDLLVALCVHGSSHLWSSLRWIADVARLVERQADLDWDYLWEEHGHPDLRRITTLGLLVAQEIAAATIPDGVLKKARADRGSLALAARVQRQLFEQPARSYLAATVRSIGFRGQLRTAWTRRLAYMSSAVLAPTVIEWDRPVPAALYPAYFLLRPLRLLAKHGAPLLPPRRR